MMNYRLVLLLLLLIGCQTEKEAEYAEKSATRTVFVGTYTRPEGHVDGKGEGIYVFEQDSLSGNLKKMGTEARIINPSFLAPSHNGKFLYAVEEIGPGADTSGRLVAYARNGNRLQKINQQSSQAFAPCHLTTDRQGRYLFAANYVGGIIVMLPIRTDGGLAEIRTLVELSGEGPHPRQEASHPHSVNLSPDERFLYVPDLGTDRISGFRIDYENGQLIPLQTNAAMRPGAGPRHLTFHPDLPYAYVINELNGTITALQWTAGTGALDTLQTISTLPSGFNGENVSSDIHITPDGAFLFGANRGHNSLAGYRINPENGTLTSIGHTSTRGDFPRNFAISPDGHFIYAAHQNSNDIQIFRIESNGVLTHRHEVKTPTPVCIQFLR